MPAEAVTAALKRVWEILDELNVPKAIMGGLSLAAWGHVRSTQDVDLLISLTGIRTQTLLAKLAASGFRAKGRAPIIRLEDVEFIQVLYEPPETFLDIQVDLLMADSEFQRQALANRVSMSNSLLGFDAAVLRCEDLIVLKLLANRAIDRMDAAALVRANRSSLEVTHLRTWVGHYQLGRLFQEAWREACPDEPSPV